MAENENQSEQKVSKEKEPDKMNARSGFWGKLFKPFVFFYRALRWVVKGVGLVLYQLIGKYTPPPWLRFLFTSPIKLLRYKIALLKRWKKAHRLSFWLVVPAGNVAVVALLAVLLWPGPPSIGYNINPPGAPDLEYGGDPDPVRVNFFRSVARLDLVGKIVKEGVSLSPALQGEWRWQADDQLVFRPTQKWGVGVDYTVDMDPDIFAPNSMPSGASKDFHSAPMQVHRTETEFYQDPNQPRIKKALVRVSFSHPVDPDDFKNRVEMRVYPQKEKRGWLITGGRDIPFEIGYNARMTEATISSRALQLAPEGTRVEVFVDDGTRSQWGGGGSNDEVLGKVNLPGARFYFAMKEARLTLVTNEHLDYEQVLVMETSAGIASEKLAKNLEAYLLPKDKPEMEGLPAQPNYRWNDPDEIGPEVLAKALRLKLETLPTDQPYPKLHSFRLKTEEKRQLYYRIDKNTETPDGFTFNRHISGILKVPPSPREVRVVHDGAMLSLSGDKTISVAARDLEAVRFEVSKIPFSEVQHLVTQASGEFQSPVFENYLFSEDNIAPKAHQVRVLGPVPREGKGKVRYVAFDFAPYLKKSPGERATGLFMLNVKGWDARRKRELGEGDRRLVMVTDLGLMVKAAGNGTQYAFVQSISKGRPVAAAKVVVLGKNGLPIHQGVTNNRGMVVIPRLQESNREKSPVAYVVMKDGDYAFLPFQGFGRWLNFSRFKVGGYQMDANDRKKGMDAYLFSDRGIYRPGDAFNVGLIVKPDKWGKSLKGVPLEAVITDPRGMEVERKRIRLTPSGFEELQYKTEDTSPTGQYAVNLYVVKDDKRGAWLNSTEVRLEEFVPDNLRIAVNLTPLVGKGWLKPEGMKGTVNLKTLFGQPAAGRNVTSTLTLSPATPRFPGFDGYVFNDPHKAKKRITERLPLVLTDKEGNAEIPLPMERFAQATYRMTFSAEGHEAEGGRAVTGGIRALVSPLAGLVGVKPDGDFSYIRQGTRRTVNLIHIDPNLKKTARTGLTRQLIEIRHVSVLARQDDNTYKYESIKKEVVLEDRPFQISAKGLDYALPTAKIGDFVLVVRDDAIGTPVGQTVDQPEQSVKKGVVLASVPFTVAGTGQLTRGLEKNAELQIRLSKQDYSPGETIEMQIRAPYTGSGLITIERETVFAYQWFRAEKTTSIQRIKIPAGLEGNAYVNVAFVRATDSREIYTSPLSYGVAPFTLNRKARTFKIDLQVPKKAKPGESLVVRYSGNKPGRIALIAVDEGILQVARYKTPDPLGHFFRKRALGVSTAQILDQLLPEYRVVRALSAPGGGGGLFDKMEMMAEAGSNAFAPAQKAKRSRLLKANLNAFQMEQIQAVAYWSGLKEIGPKTREHRFTIPGHFSGSVRVMAVAVTPDSIGVARQKTIVRGPFVITPNAPLFVAPGDTFKVSVSVANTLEGSGKNAGATVRLKASKSVKVLNGAERKLVIAEGREGVVSFELEANNTPGVVELKLEAEHDQKNGGKTARLSTFFSLRPAIHHQTVVSSGYVEKGQAELPLTRSLFTELRTVEASASTVPMGLGQGLADYLRDYPYQCTEQLISQAMPAMVLKGRPEFGYKPKAVEKSLGDVLRILQTRQTPEGAFSFWAAHTRVSDLQSVYALHFLTELRERGQAVPSRLMVRGLKYLRRLTRRKPRDLPEAREQAYALYVLTRNGQVPANRVDDLRETLEAWEGETLEGKAWETDLTGIYLAAAYRLMKQKDRAAELMDKNPPGIAQEPDYRHFYDGMVREAQLLYLTARHFPQRLSGMSGQALANLSEAISGNQYNTLSSAYAMLALDAYAKVAGEPEQAGLTMLAIMKDGREQVLKLPEGLFPSVPVSAEAEKVRFLARGDRPLFYQLTESGYDLKPPDKPMLEGLEIQREYRNLDGETVTKAALGETLEVHLKLRALDGDTLPNIAVVDLLPGGFEVVLDSIPFGQIPVPLVRARGGEEGSEGGEGEPMVLGIASEEEVQQVMGMIRESTEGGEMELPTDIRIVQEGNTFRLVRGETGDSLVPEEEPPPPSREPWLNFPEYVDAREDRVLVFGPVSDGVQSFVYRIRATNAGKYMVPPAYAESMYDRMVKARALGGIMEVERGK